jgi:phage terminase large subunit-like protein
MDQANVHGGRPDGQVKRPAWIESEHSPRPPTPNNTGSARPIRRPDRAKRVIQFFRHYLKIPSGIGVGEPFELRQFQQQFIRDIYEPHDRESGNRLVRRAILSIARKNGKTGLIAGLALTHLIGPEQIKNGEIYSAANDREQAAQVFKMAKQMVELNPVLSQKLRVVPSTKTIVNYSNGSFYRAISAEAGTKHGFNPTVVIFDELAQAKSRDLYDVLDTSFGGRAEPLFITISTQSNDPEHILSKLIDDGLSGSDPSIVCHLYAADEDCALDDQSQWGKANPALGDFRDYNDFTSLINKAIRMPSEEPKTRNLFLNQRVAPTASLISRAEWMACKGVVEFKEGEAVYLALDLSSTNDLTALIMGSEAEPTKIKPFFWKPKDHISAHSQRDFGSGNKRYEEWMAAGHLFTTPGRAIDPSVIATFITELYQVYDIKGMAYDRWRIADLTREVERLGFETYVESPTEKYQSGLRMIPWGQGYRDMAPAIDALEIAVMERKLIHGSSPLLNWNMANAVSTVDPAGNRKIDKDKARFRIDGAVALAMLMGLKARDKKEAKIDIDSLISWA